MPYVGVCFTCVQANSAASPSTSSTTSKKDRPSSSAKPRESGRTSTTKRKSEEPTAPSTNNKSKRTDTEDSNSDIVAAGGTGFDRGLEAEKILGASDNNGRLTFLIQFKGVDQAEMVPSTVANVKIPQMVIRFYEERLSWYSDNED